MAILTFALGALMILASFGLLWGSLNLVPTEMGLLYGVCGVVLLGCGAIVVAIGALITRVSRLLARARTPTAAEPPRVEPPRVEPQRIEPQLEPAPEEAEAQTAPSAPPQFAASAPVADTREVERVRPAVAEATSGGKPEPYVIGRYAAGGANYAIFSDGTIEAETDEGAMRFATMSEFRAYISARKR
jgi:hypothetical protein